MDDLEAVGVAFERVLTAAGFSVERASDGWGATELLRERQFDAIVSDIAMPGMSGIALLRAVREHDLDVPVLLVTGNPTVETAMKAVEYGALRYLCKPVPPKVIVAEVDKAVRLGQVARMKRAALDLHGDASLHLGDRAALELYFARAVDALWTAYQPIVRYSDRSVVGFEALMRSDEPQLRSPEAILDAAERLGRREILGRAVRRNIGDVVKAAPIPLVFVNLHPCDLLDADLFAPDSPLCQMASKVVLEITERASLEHVKDIGARVADLRKLGFRIALDDMGAGYAGLNSITQLEPDVIKLDMNLVRNVDCEPTKQKLVAAMAALCREMNMMVIAEGVETTSERDTLVRLGCDLMQGYLFAKPDRPFPAARF